MIFACGILTILVSGSESVNCRLTIYRDSPLSAATKDKLRKIKDVDPAPLYRIQVVSDSGRDIQNSRCP